MNNVQQFSSKQDIEQQACDWISKIDRGLNGTETESFSVWVNTSEAHRQCLFEMAKNWDELSILNQLSGLITPERQSKQLFNNLYSRKNMSIAASFIFVCLCFVSVFTLMQPTTSVGESLAFNLDAETTIGEQRILSLADGSTIHLNTDSRVYVEFSHAKREINLLQGEAYFDVAHDVERPFIVRSGEKSVTAVGTAFNVQLTQDDQFELLVTDGKVLVKQDQIRSQGGASNQGTLMIVGQKALVSSTEIVKMELTENQSQQELAWQQGMLVFHGEPLEQALQEITRYTSVNFDLADNKVRQRRVAGYFKANDVQGLLFALENNFNINHQRLQNNTILLSSGI